MSHSRRTPGDSGLRQPVGRLLTITTLSVLVGAVTTACTASSNADVTGGAASAQIEKGRYLVTVAGCNDCHTPWTMGPNGPEPDMSRMLSGHPADFVLSPPPATNGGWMMTASSTFTSFAGPWGISYTANLTPDELTGIGIWTEDIFINTIRKGRHWGVSRPILPPMPWQNFAQMTDDDLKAIFAYLKSIPPIRNQVPEPVIAGE